MPAKKKTTATPTGLQADAHADRSAALAELRAKEARARDGRVASLQDRILNKGLACLFRGDDPQRTLTHHREAGA